MKIKHFVILLCLAFVACNDAQKNTNEKPTPKKEVPAKTTKMKTHVGEFIKVDDAAILKGRDFIYGVVLDSMGMELANRAEALKYDEYDMIPVVLTGDIIPNEAEDGWEELIKVKQIVRISEPKMEETIEIKKSIN